MSEPPAGTRPSAALLAGLAAFVLLFTAAGYAWLGNVAGLGVGPQLEGMVERLALRLRQQPGDAEGWAMLGRSYAVLGRFPEAMAAYRQLIALRPRDAQAHADYADVLASAHGGELLGEPQRLIEQALALDPDNLKALALAGSAALRRGDMAAARGHWERALSLAEPGSELALEFQAMIASTRSGQAAAALAEIRGRVTLAPALNARAAPDDTLFVFARAAQGTPMPLAILRKKVRDLPLEFSLDDSLAMSPALRLSGLSGTAQVIVGARISRSGQALPQPGDLQVLSAPLAVGTRGVELQIGEVLR
jgi:cytochrome c-type biogenesis protein CcmH